MRVERLVVRRPEHRGADAAQPFRIPDPGKPEASQTIWQVVLDRATHFSARSRSPSRYADILGANPRFATYWKDVGVRLDAVRAGIGLTHVDPDARRQDDLFGCVNGRRLTAVLGARQWVRTWN